MSEQRDKPSKEFEAWWYEWLGQRQSAGLPGAQDAARAAWAASRRCVSGYEAQSAKAVALLSLLADTPPVKRWKEVRDRGEERIPCFLAVETAREIAEFFNSTENPK